VWPDKIDLFRSAATRLQLRVSERFLRFLEVELIPVFANAEDMQTLVIATGAVEQLRYASDTPSFFTTEIRREQDRWVGDLVSRISGPPLDGPTVCLLDSGVAQSHPLLALALVQNDCLSVDPVWGTADHEPGGHGTNMAGAILYGDLTYPLADNRDVSLNFRLESVKFLPPPGFQPAEPESYGSITQAAVSTIEIHAPERNRVFCMAATNRDISASGGRAGAQLWIRPQAEG